LGERFFRHNELQDAYRRLSNPTVRLTSPGACLAYLILKVWARLGLMQRSRAVYVSRYIAANTSDEVTQLQVFSSETVHQLLNRIYDMPDVIVDPTRRKTVNVLVPAFEFRSMSAGFFGVFQAARLLKDCGHHVRLVMFDNFRFDADAFAKSFKDYPGLEDTLDALECEYIGERKDPLRVSPADDCVATVWYSAYLAEKIMRRIGGRPFLYLIQDYETNFYAANSLFALADRTYDMNYHALFSTTVLQQFFIDRDIGHMVSRGLKHIHFNNACASARPERRTFLARAGNKNKRTLAFYSRPIVNRNMFELGAVTLIESVRAGILDPDRWEFRGIGLGSCVIRLTEDAELLQIPRTSLKEYQRIITDFDVGLTLMASPHPSMVPFDLAGCGTVVVTNSFLNKDQAYFEGLAPNVICREPHLPALMDGLAEAVARAEDVEARYQGALDMAYPRSWSQTWTDAHRTFVKEALG